MEKWVDIIWYEWLYQISNFGNIKKNYIPEYKWSRNRLFWWIPEKILKPNIRHWYLVVWLTKNRKYKNISVHRLVYFSFNKIPLDFYNPYIKSCVCHKDDNWLNPRLDNLFLWSHKDNMDDMRNKWRKKVVYWEDTWNSKLKNQDVVKIKKILEQIKNKEIKKTKISLAKDFNITFQTIYGIEKWYIWKHIFII